MTPHQDIIGIVKELGARRKKTRSPRVLFWDFQAGLMGALSIAEKARSVEYIEHLDKHFPAIAQALLIAVEGLEWFEKCEADPWINPEADKLKAELLNELALKPVNNKAKEFLDRIRSLSRCC